MATRWCGIFGQDPAKENKSSVLRAQAKNLRVLGLLCTCALSLSAAQVSMVYAQDPDPNQSPSSAPADATFLALPTVNVQPMEAAKTYFVGDRVVLRTEPAEVGDQMQLVPNDQLFDQGWTIGAGLVVVPIKTGQLTLPSIGLKNTQGQLVARTNPMTLQVQSAINKDDPKPQEPAAVQPPVRVGFPLLWTIIISVLALALITVLGVWLFRRIQAVRRSRMPPKPERPLHESILDELSALATRGLLQKGEYKKYYFGISEILKKYFGRRFDFDALESTSAELMHSLRERAGLLSAAQLDSISELFERLDIVKFTDHQPSESDAVSCLEQARKIVEETRARTEPALNQPLVDYSKLSQSVERGQP